MRLVASLAAALSASSAVLTAQGPAPLPVYNPAGALSAILDQAGKNIEIYQASLPNVYCTEHVLARRKVANSAMGGEMAVPGGSVPLERSATVENSADATSIFRLKRLEKPSELGLFEESRLLQKVTYSADAPGFEEIAIPDLLYGVFSNGLNILSQDGRRCFDFKLKKSQTGKPGKSLTVDFKDLPSSQKGTGCPADEGGTGTIRIDPVTLHVTEIERKLPHHVLVGGIEGTWEWKAEYSPVLLKGETFWLPASISSRSVSSDQRRIWTYAATYRDYHLFYATTRILPAPGL